MGTCNCNKYYVLASRQSTPPPPSPTFNFMYYYVTAFSLVTPFDAAGRPPWCAVHQRQAVIFSAE